MKRQYEYLLVFILIVVISGTIGLFFYLKNKIQQNHLKNIMEGHYSDTRFLKSIIENSISRFERDLSVLKGEVINVKSKDDLGRLFLNFHKLNNIYDQVRFIDINGLEVIRTDNKKGYIRMADTLQNKSEMAYFIQTMKLKPGEVYISPITLNREFGELEIPYRDMLRIATPVYKDDNPLSPLTNLSPKVLIGEGEFMGVIVLNIEPDYLFQILWGYEPEYRGHTWVYSNDMKETIDEDTGNVVHTNFLYCTTGLLPKKHLTYIKFLLNENREGITNKDKEFFAVSKVNFLGMEWFIVSESNINEIMSQPNEIMNDFLKSGLITSIIIASLISLIIFFNLKRQRVEERFELAKQMDRQKIDFLNTIAHDLRTPLTSIKAYTGMLIMYKDKPETFQKVYVEFLNIINKEIVRLENLINDYLNLAKMEIGRIIFRREAVDIKGIIDDTLTTYGGEAREKGIVLKSSFSDDIPIIVADDSKLRQVVSNLISNAVKYTPEGGTVTASAVKNGDSVKLYIEDTGPGIPKEHHDKIFEKFVQLNDGKEKFKKGTGLGLPIVKNIVEHHGGRGWGESEAGKGARFIVSFPIK